MSTASSRAASPTTTLTLDNETTSNAIAALVGKRRDRKDLPPAGFEPRILGLLRHDQPTASWSMTPASVAVTIDIEGHVLNTGNGEHQACWSATARSTSSTTRLTTCESSDSTPRTRAPGPSSSRTRIEVSDGRSPSSRSTNRPRPGYTKDRGQRAPRPSPPRSPRSVLDLSIPTHGLALWLDGRSDPGSHQEEAHREQHLARHHCVSASEVTDWDSIEVTGTPHRLDDGPYYYQGLALQLKRHTPTARTVKTV